MPSIPDIAPRLIDFPWHYLALGIALCLVVSALGFRRVVYFVSLGYAASIAVQAIVIPLLSWDTLRGWVLIQAALLLAYGLRLGTFLTLRDRTASYRKEQGENAARGTAVRGPVKVAIWFGVSVLYTLMFFPASLTMAAQAAHQVLPSVPLGVATMIAGLGFEACSDWQKSRFKQRNPSRFCDGGLFRVVRHPNYFGEMVFWSGSSISAISAYQNLLGWVLGGLGLVCIELVMLGASRRLESKQTDRYGADATYRAYAKHTPILFPLLPLYSIRKPKVPRGKT